MQTCKEWRELGLRNQTWIHLQKYLFVDPHIYSGMENRLNSQGKSIYFLYRALESTIDFSLSDSAIKALQCEEEEEKEKEDDSQTEIEMAEHEEMEREYRIEEEKGSQSIIRDREALVNELNRLLKEQTERKLNEPDEDEGTAKKRKV